MICIIWFLVQLYNVKFHCRLVHNEWISARANVLHCTAPTSRGWVSRAHKHMPGATNTGSGVFTQTTSSHYQRLVGCNPVAIQLTCTSVGFGAHNVNKPNSVNKHRKPKQNMWSTVLLCNPIWYLFSLILCGTYSNTKYVTYSYRWYSNLDSNRISDTTDSSIELVISPIQIGDIIHSWFKSWNCDNSYIPIYHIFQWMISPIRIAYLTIWGPVFTI